jgi:hypothetical protein
VSSTEKSQDDGRYIAPAISAFPQSLVVSTDSVDRGNFVDEKAEDQKCSRHFLAFTPSMEISAECIVAKRPS